MRGNSTSEIPSHCSYISPATGCIIPQIYPAPMLHRVITRLSSSSCEVSFIKSLMATPHDSLFTFYRGEVAKDAPKLKFHSSAAVAFSITCPVQSCEG